MQLESLTPEQRARIAVPFRRFMAAIKEQRRFDQQVAASIERLLCDPVHRARIVRMISPNKDTSDVEHCRE
jgi:hypothetical protein